jgi:hypothetical protein
MMNGIPKSSSFNVTHEEEDEDEDCVPDGNNP